MIGWQDFSETSFLTSSLASFSWSFFVVLACTAEVADGDSLDRTSVGVEGAMGCDATMNRPFNDLQLKVLLISWLDKRAPLSIPRSVCALAETCSVYAGETGRCGTVAAERAASTHLIKIMLRLSHTNILEKKAQSQM